jgi:hypothetical protein
MVYDKHVECNHEGQFLDGSKWAQDCLQA